eukprot:8973173-Karenia_brevis.AAC.1
MVMTILLHDAREMLKMDYNIELDSNDINELIYADDTLLVGSSVNHLQMYMQCISTVGCEYGLTLNWKKVDQLNINCDDRYLIDEHGESIQ